MSDKDVRRYKELIRKGDELNDSLRQKAANLKNLTQKQKELKKIKKELEALRKKYDWPVPYDS